MGSGNQIDRTKSWLQRVEAAGLETSEALDIQELRVLLQEAPTLKVCFILHFF